MGAMIDRSRETKALSEITCQRTGVGATPPPPDDKTSEMPRAEEIDLYLRAGHLLPISRVEVVQAYLSANYLTETLVARKRVIDRNERLAKRRATALRNPAGC